VKNPSIFPPIHIPKSGVYTLVISVPSEKRIRIGKIGVQSFPAGYYAYTGSALGGGSVSLGGRISRHTRKNKRKRWHIDFLLGVRDVEVISAFIVSANERMECEINQYLHGKMHAQIPILKFGSSDCDRGCGSHLLYFGHDEDVVKKLTKLYEEKAGHRLATVNF